ncbi:MAG: acyl-CoA dehydratase activase-related protein [Eubacteriales bacterium]|nr:acyl-CoA dehydratase activase-related protein [Eubacteriales bacterium]MDD4078732.1 acyl-CoA dehydratase activase-related protein [Eubacteriales bacterium]MDD4768610.1 acyl-CoA dehydratase activase-related protein [Eubacteriales bacterium]
MRIGLPRALLYYNYRPALEYLARENAAEIIVSSATNKLKLEQGLALCDDEVCLPVKVMMGHVQSLLQEDVDALFVPRIISLEKKRYICPKFLGLPDMVRAGLGTKIPLISPAINVSWSRLRQLREGIKSLRPLPRQPLKLWGALGRAARVQELHRRQLAAALDLPSPGKRVAVLGHAYNIFDEYLNFGILNKLSALGVEPVTVENFSRGQINQGASGLCKDLFWSYGREVVGAAFYCLNFKAVDGVILVASFGCGPDSLITEIIGRRFSDSSIPLMSIILDEHSSGIGLATRVEAFVDMLNWRDMA